MNKVRDYIGNSSMTKQSRENKPPMMTRIFTLITLASASAKLLATPLSPEQISDHREYASVLTAKGDFDDATQVYHDLLASELSDNDRTQILLLAAQNQEWSGNIEASLPLYRQYVERAPDDYETALNFASLLVGHGAVEEGEERLANLVIAQQSAALLDPANLDAHRMIATASMLLENWALAAEEFAILTLMDPTNAKWYSLHGDALQHLGQYTFAEQEYHQALEIDPKESLAVRGLAVLEETTLRPIQAYNTFSKLIELPQVVASDHVALARTLGTGGHFAEAQRKLAELPPADDVTLLKGQLLAWAGKTYEAARYWDRQEQNGAVSHERALVYQMLGDTQRAEEQLNRSLELGFQEDPAPPLDDEDSLSRSIALTREAQLLATTDAAEAANLLQQALELNPTSSTIRLRLIMLQTAVGQAEASDNQLTAFLEEFPNHETALLLHARNLSASGKFSEAEQVYQHLLKLDPQHGIAHLELARILGWTGNYRESFEQYRSLVHSNMAAAAVAQLEYTAKNHNYQRRKFRAIAAMEELLKTDPTNQEIRFTLAQLYASEHEHARAAQEYDTILAMAPLNRATRAVSRHSELLCCPQIRFQSAFTHEDGRDNLKDLDRFRLGIEILWPCCEHVPYASISNTLYKGNRFEDNSLDLDLGVDGKLSYRTAYHASIQIHHYDSTLGTTVGWRGRLSRAIGDKSTATIGISREDALNSRYSFDDRVYVDSFWLEAHHWLTRCNPLLFRYTYESYSDNNNGHVVRGSAGQILSENQGSKLTAYAGVFAKDVQNPTVTLLTIPVTHPYWTPDWYWEGYAELEYEKHCADEFFFEYDPFWYTLSIRGGSDLDGNLIGAFRGELHRAWGHWRLSTHLYTSVSDPYKLFEAGLTLGYIF